MNGSKYLEQVHEWVEVFRLGPILNLFRNLLYSPVVYVSQGKSQPRTQALSTTLHEVGQKLSLGDGEFDFRNNPRFVSTVEFNSFLIWGNNCIHYDYLYQYK
jgi:hypothetical protein